LFDLCQTSAAISRSCTTGSDGDGPPANFLSGLRYLNKDQQKWRDG